MTTSAAPPSDEQGPAGFGDWLQTHRDLMQLEASFTALAMQAAEGKYPEEQLAEQRAVLEATRTLCAAAYQRAFPNAVPQGKKT